MTVAADELAAVLGGVTSLVLRPSPRLPLDRWAEAHRKIPTGGSGSRATARLDLDRTPQLRGVLRAASDPTVREVRVLKSTQTGFSEGVLNTVACHSVAELGRTLLYLYPTRDDAKNYNERRLMPAVEGCPSARRKLALDDKRKASTASEWRFVDCRILFAYTGGTSSLRMDPVGRALLDEVDAYVLDSAADPFESVRSRQETFPDALTVMGSSPKLTAGGIIDRYGHPEMGADVRCEYHTPCPSCGHYFELFSFDRLAWFGGLGADPEQAAADVHVKCPSCGSKIRETAKVWMVLNGLWVTQGEHVESDGSITATYDPHTHLPTDPDRVCSRFATDFFRDASEAAWPDERDAGLAPGDAAALRASLGVRVAGIRSTGRSVAFRLNRLTSLISSEGWAGLVSDFVKARGNLPNTWWGERLATFPQLGGREAAHGELRSLCVPDRAPGVVPAWASFLVVSVDVQKVCVKVGVWAFAPGMRRRALVETALVPRREENNLLEPEILRYLAGIRPESERTGEPVVPVYMVDTGHYTLDAYGLVDRLRAAVAADLPRPRRNAGVWPVKGDNRPNPDRPYRIGSRHESKIPGATGRVRGVDVNDLVLVNTAMLKDGLVPLLAPREHGGVGPEPVELPDASLWVDGYAPGHPVTDLVVGELVNEHKVRAGSGSGLTGPLGRGAPRDEWVKVKAHKPNDQLDIAVYSAGAAYLYQVHTDTGRDGGQDDHQHGGA